VTKPRNKRLSLLVGLLAVAASVAACSTGSSGNTGPTTTPTTGGAAATTPSTGGAATSAPATPTTPAASPVHIRAYPGDGATVGVGMPVIATFNKKITDGAAFAKAATVTVNGQPANGAWYFEYTDPASGHVMEAHYRPETYWPGHARIHVSFDTKGVSAGKGLAFDDSLTLDYATGPANILTVDDRTHTLTVVSDKKEWGRFKVSLGARDTPTKRGSKVIMEKGADICMSGNPPNGPSYHECHVKWTQRLTYDGEYLHAAPWNTVNIANGVDSSNGCTNLDTNDAKKLYDFLRIGDVVQYPNANGPLMQLGDGYGDWNVPWGQWQTGGAIPTS
jgi:lipoprotein-anchoring transpeptidase ErfK/SrfK